ncbi:MAG: hypothetical protein ACE14L_13475 [Terriglobales bacterium]
MKHLALIFTVLLLVCASLAQTTAPQPTPPAPPPPVQAPAPPAEKPDKPAAETQPETKITPEQAKELLASVDEILQFVSRDTGLPIKHRVNRQLASRAEVVQYIQDRMKSDEDSRRLERSAVVLKKFGMVPRDFNLRAFLLELLGEQVAGFYDSKKKTVFLLDWVEPGQQKPVLAHELTHALQDQNFGLQKLDKEAKKDDPTGLEADERIAARQAMIEGQAMIVLIDYMLQPLGSSVARQPEVVETVQAGMTQSGPGMAVYNRAPLFLQQVLLFPYRFGTPFARDLLVKSGREMAFAGALRNPPRNTRQIMQPETYLAGQYVAPLKPVSFEKLAASYKEWDLSVMGQFDVHLLMQEYASPEAAEVLSRNWRGGYYWAGLVPQHTKEAEEDPTTADIAVAYVSKWSDDDAAAQFAGAYAAALKKRYKVLQPLPGSAPVIAPEPLEPPAPVCPEGKTCGPEDTPKVTITVWPRLDGRASWSTNEGEVTIEPRGDMVLVTEGLDASAVQRVREAVFR